MVGILIQWTSKNLVKNLVLVSTEYVQESYFLNYI